LTSTNYVLKLDLAKPLCLAYKIIFSIVFNIDFQILNTNFYIVP